MRYTCVFLAILLTPFYVYPQADMPKKDFAFTDSLARTIRYHGDVYTHTRELTTPYNDQLSKTRAIFIWITDNIAYDYKAVNKGKPAPRIPPCVPGTDCQRVMQDWENKYLQRILKKKKSVCEGYARLFKKMCNIAGVRCEVVSGYIKTRYYHIGRAGAVDHAWNAVYLDSSWHMVDPTWAAGGCDEDENIGKLQSFEKLFNNYYWQASYSDFHRNHYPEKGQWAFKENYTKEKFAAAPYIAGSVISDLRLLSPEPGIIQARKGDTIRFRFTYRGQLTYLQANSNLFRNPTTYRMEKVSRRRWQPVWDTFALKKQQYVSFRKSFRGYAFEYVVTDENLNYIDILFDYERAFRYKVNIIREPVQLAGK
ncbi:transglutaminase domain-containing protein [Chitinophaga sp. HK235]|uniref:transglutaminase domain-containing protein n=1 Tax=Chitinophaga sp. HK235 TaxID=2952571 RepID=UPI001BAB2B7C|nr:transglutaminase domain-containing protein [Chitinophaga sp. HK235]